MKATNPSNPTQGPKYKPGDAVMTTIGDDYNTLHLARIDTRGIHAMTSEGFPSFAYQVVIPSQGFQGRDYATMRMEDNLKPVTPATMPGILAR